MTGDSEVRLRRYWLRFAIAPGELDQHPSWVGLGLGCGVTAYTLDDAMTVLRAEIFGADSIPEIEELVEDIDVSSLDQGRVAPNMAPPNERGVWFPRL